MSENRVIKKTVSPNDQWYMVKISISISLLYNSYIHSCNSSCYPLVMTNMAIENGDLSTENGDFP